MQQPRKAYSRPVLISLLAARENCSAGRGAKDVLVGGADEAFHVKQKRIKVPAKNLKRCPVYSKRLVRNRPKTDT